MKVYAGTSGYSYKEWKGHFYPEKLSDKEFLKYYGSQLPSVEINNTFYRLPKESVLLGWAEQVPAKFRFSVKASQKITHFKRLKDVAEETQYLLRIASVLEKKLGVILFQMPPNMKKDLPRLEEFMKLLPDTMRFAFEFRHETWFDAEVYGLLRSHDCSLCIADTEEGKLDTPLVRTASWGYLRLRKPNYSKKDLTKWLKDIEEQKWKDVFIFFKHEDAGAGPKMAKQFLGLVE